MNENWSHIHTVWGWWTKPCCCCWRIVGIFFAFYLKIHGGEEFEVEILKSFRPEVFIIVRGAKSVCFFSWPFLCLQVFNWITCYYLDVIVVSLSGLIERQMNARWTSSGYGTCSDCGLFTTLTLLQKCWQRMPNYIDYLWNIFEVW